MSRVFTGQPLGIREVADNIGLAEGSAPTFVDYDLGFFDQDENRVKPVGENPFAPKL